MHPAARQNEPLRSFFSVRVVSHGSSTILPVSSNRVLRIRPIFFGVDVPTRMPCRDVISPATT
eukprot:scaffold17996_cov194-Amphora_coffeaeformis.AAC.5